MGERFFRYFDQKVSPACRLAFLSAGITTLLIHLYKFTNTLPNHDSLFNFYSDQNVLGSGRWALSIACGISSFYDLPWVIGLVCCVFIGMTSALVTALYGMENPVLILLSGALLAASPATTETFFFLFTADGYMIAMFLAALGAYLSRIGEFSRCRTLLSIVCICVSCGIYQAYVSFALLLSVCHLLQILLENRADKQTCLRWVCQQILIYAMALASYYLIWKLVLHVTGTGVNHYQGIDSIGFNVPTLLRGIFRAVKTVLLHFLQWNVLEHGFSLYSVLNILFLSALGVILGLSFRKSGIFQRKWALILMLLGLAAIMPFAGIWHLVSDEVGYRAMMLQSLTVLHIFGGILFEKWATAFGKDIMGILLTIILLNHGLMANISYFYMNQCYERTFAEATEMVVSIHLLQDEYEFDKIAVVGTRIYEVQYQTADPTTGRMLLPGKTHILSSCLEQTLLFDAEHTCLFLKNLFGVELEPVGRKERNALLRTQTVQAMPCWPSRDSMTVIGDTLVIKLSDRAE